MRTPPLPCSLLLSPLCDVWPPLEGPGVPPERVDAVSSWSLLQEGCGGTNQIERSVNTGSVGSRRTTTMRWEAKADNHVIFPVPLHKPCQLKAILAHLRFANVCFYAKIISTNSYSRSNCMLYYQGKQKHSMQRREKMLPLGSDCIFNINGTLCINSLLLWKCKVRVVVYNAEIYRGLQFILEDEHGRASKTSQLGWGP